MYRGSRKHVLDWTESRTFRHELADLLSPIPVTIRARDTWMPRGFDNPDEARLETFGPSWMPSHPAWRKLANWWLAHERGANTPNWDIAVGCAVDDRPGLVLVEANANWPELKCDGKSLSEDASRNSRENHARIGQAIAEACRG